MKIKLILALFPNLAIILIRSKMKGLLIWRKLTSKCFILELITLWGQIGRFKSLRDTWCTTISNAICKTFQSSMGLSTMPIVDLRPTTTQESSKLLFQTISLSIYILNLAKHKELEVQLTAWRTSKKVLNALWKLYIILANHVQKWS